MRLEGAKRENKCHDFQKNLLHTKSHRSTCCHSVTLKYPARARPLYELKIEVLLVKLVCAIMHIVHYFAPHVTSEVVLSHCVFD